MANAREDRGISRSSLHAQWAQFRRWEVEEVVE